MKNFSEIRESIKKFGYLGKSYFKETLNSNLSESGSGVGMQPDVSVDDTEQGNFLNLNDERSLNQLNAFVGSISYRSYIDPLTAVRNLQNKLGMIGLKFDCSANESMMFHEGSLTFPLYRFGTTFGFSKKLDGTFVNNLKTMGEDSSCELSLVMNFKKEINGLTTITAKVEKTTE
jgi:hypothetical protein